MLTAQRQVRMARDQPGTPTHGGHLNANRTSVLVGALAMLETEPSGADANVTTSPDALWFAITTVTTVGYGDWYPGTGVGRVVAASLILVGISLIGVVTAAVAAWFDRGEAEEPPLRQRRPAIPNRERCVLSS